MESFLRCFIITVFIDQCVFCQKVLLDLDEYGFPDSSGEECYNPLDPKCRAYGGSSESDELPTPAYLDPLIVLTTSSPIPDPDNNDADPGAYDIIQIDEMDDKSPEPRNETAISGTCTSQESVCSSCDVVLRCTAYGNGAFLALPVECKPGEKCIKGKCTAGAFCNQGKFVCQQEGIFPDPYNCKLFHTCFPSGDTFKKGIHTCGPTAYHAGEKCCGFSVKSLSCTQRPVPECEEIGQMGIVRDSPEFYYVCVRTGDSVIPYIYKCPEGLIFLPQEMKCVIDDSDVNRKTDQEEFMYCF